MKRSVISCMGTDKRPALALAGLACLAAALLSVCLGAAKISPAELLAALFSGGQTPAAGIVRYVRLPRTAACLAAGAALAVSGAIIQSVLANPLASPNIIGVNAGAGLMVGLCCAFLPTMGRGLSGAAFLGAMAAVLLVLGIARRIGASRMTVILAGVAVNAFLNAGTDAVVTLFPDAGIGSADFRVGGFSAVPAGRLWPAALLILMGVALSFTLANELDLLALGEDTAHGLGLSVRRMQFLLLGIAAVLAGATVSFAGQLGFVGLIVPHLARRLVGSGNGILLPMCALSGAALVTLCDLAARLLFAPYELPVGILLSLIGGPFFLMLLVRQRGGRLHD